MHRCRRHRGRSHRRNQPTAGRPRRSRCRQHRTRFRRHLQGGAEIRDDAAAAAAPPPAGCSNCRCSATTPRHRARRKGRRRPAADRLTTATPTRNYGRRSHLRCRRMRIRRSRMAPGSTEQSSPTTAYPRPRSPMNHRSKQTTAPVEANHQSHKRESSESPPPPPQKKNTIIATTLSTHFMTTDGQQTDPPPLSPLSTIYIRRHIACLADSANTNNASAPGSASRRSRRSELGSSWWWWWSVRKREHSAGKAWAVRKGARDR